MLSIKIFRMLTSNSHSALSTFSSKAVSTKLAVSLGMVDNVVSRRSTVTGMLSCHLDAESELDRGGGETDLKDIGGIEGWSGTFS
jgi:hypothetical protein